MRWIGEICLVFLGIFAVGFLLYMLFDQLRRIYRQWRKRREVSCLLRLSEDSTSYLATLPHPVFRRLIRSGYLDRIIFPLGEGIRGLAFDLQNQPWTQTSAHLFGPAGFCFERPFSSPRRCQMVVNNEYIVVEQGHTRSTVDIYDRSDMRLIRSVASPEELLFEMSLIDSRLYFLVQTVATQERLYQYDIATHVTCWVAISPTSGPDFFYGRIPEPGHFFLYRYRYAIFESSRALLSIHQDDKEVSQEIYLIDLTDDSQLVLDRHHRLFCFNFNQNYIQLSEVIR